jgi:hypothetical protein
LDLLGWTTGIRYTTFHLQTEVDDVDAHLSKSGGHSTQCVLSKQTYDMNSTEMLRYTDLQQDSHQVKRLWIQSPLRRAFSRQSICR